MPFKLGDNVYQTSSTGGVGAQDLDSPSPETDGYRPFTDVMDNNDTTLYTIWSDVTGDYEVGLGTFLDSPDRLQRDTVLRSSNGDALEAFAGGGVLNITCSLPALIAETLLDPTSGAPGFLVRRTDGVTYSRRIWENTAAHLVINNPDGEGGNQSIDDSALVTTFAGLVASNNFTGAVNFFVQLAIGTSNRLSLTDIVNSDEFIFNVGADTEMILRISRSGEDDYVLQVRESDAWVDVRTGPEPTQVFSLYEEISGITISDAGAISEAHSLGVAPIMVLAFLEIVNNTDGWVTGELIPVGWEVQPDATLSTGLSIDISSSTVITGRFANGPAAGVMRILNKTSGFATGLAVGDATLTLRLFA
jgi:hypothetical protein